MEGLIDEWVPHGHAGCAQQRAFGHAGGQHYRWCAGMTRTAFGEAARRSGGSSVRSDSPSSIDGVRTGRTSCS